MKWSIYNYKYNSRKHGILLFNMLSGAFIEIGDEDTEIEFEKIRNNPDNYDFSRKEKLLDFLISNGILCENDEENKNITEFYSLYARFDSKQRSVTILPTLNCNLACTYCYEASNLKNEKMSPIVVEGLKKYMKKEYSSLENGLKVHWYGGEPLLAHDVMISISNFLDENNICFDASIVTNGLLLNKSKISSFSSLKINEIQITLDGLKNTHDKRRMFKNGSATFDAIMENMKLLHGFVNVNRDIHVDIRINIDRENEDEYHIIYEYLKNEFPLFHPYAGILRQYTSCGSSIPCFVDQTEVADFHIRQYEKYGLIEPVFYPYLKGMSYCMAESPYSDMIGPKGEMYLCLKDTGDKNETIGDIFNGKTNVRLMASYCTGKLTFNSDRCRECKVVSLCGGGCANIKYRNSKYGEKNDPCVPFKENVYLEKYLDLHYEIKKKNAKD